jgi:hypothetical protein
MDPGWTCFSALVSEPVRDDKICHKSINTVLVTGTLFGVFTVIGGLIVLVEI